MPIENLTLQAACYMAKETLAIRNSYTKQVMSLHYGIRFYPETHSRGEGLYCVPLWTVAIPELTKNPLRIKEKIDAYKNYLYKADRSPLYDCLDPSFSRASPEEQSRYLSTFVAQIKEHIRPFAPFSLGFSGLLDYELLVCKNSSRYIDDLGKYSTGGRCRTSFDMNTICYRATLNEFEIKFIREILQHQFDEKIPGIKAEENIQVANTARYIICNQLCTEIIVAKLVMFLNAACASHPTPTLKSKAVLTLNKDELIALFDNTLSTEAERIQEIFVHKREHCILASNPPEKYLTCHKYL
jgi:hypothetical protein